MIEVRALPRGRVMAVLAKLGEILRDVVRGALEILLMAIDANQIASKHIMVKRRRGPSRHGMAALTGGRKIHRRMVWAPLKISLMARQAVQWRPAEIAGGRARMALLALQGRMHAGQWKASAGVLGDLLALVT